MSGGKMLPISIENGKYFKQCIIKNANWVIDGVNWIEESAIK